MTSSTDQPQDDGEIIARCRAGDERAWAALVERYGRLVYSVPFSLKLPAEGCDDVFQEVFMAVLRTLPTLRDQKSLPKWLMTIAHHASYRWTRRMRSPGAADLSPVPPLPGGPAHEDLIRWERQELVRRALARLGGNCERLLRALFRRTDGGGYHEVAAQLGMPVGSIGPTRNRCLRKLMDILDEMAPEGPP
jgi:RNA polymerase sigma factor (sigma-70 family)